MKHHNHHPPDDSLPSMSARSKAITDRPVKATADDALIAKLATTRAGYYVDPFLDAVSAGQDNHKIPTRTVHVQPIIKKGTHARVCVMDRAIATFLNMKTTSSSSSSSQSAAAYQVVVLGAGKDTSYFRLRNGNIMGMQPQSSVKSPQVHWYEVDHVGVVQEKAKLIRKSNLLKSYCPLLVPTEHGYESNSGSSSSSGSLLGRLGSLRKPTTTTTTTTTPSSYHLIGHDLRDSPQTLVAKLGLDPRLPTLVLMECVSMYVPIAASRNLLAAVATMADTVALACYEPILCDDPFGTVMERNLSRRGLATPDSCLLQTRTLPAQLSKLCENGFVRAVGCDMWSAYNTIVDEEQRSRAKRSEFLDEYEEWVLIMKHYCFVVATGGTNPTRSVDEMTRILAAPNEEEERDATMGWVAGNCLELEESSSSSSSSSSST